jgi:hypothetical protein
MNEYLILEVILLLALSAAQLCSDLACNKSAPRPV